MDVWTQIDYQGGKILGGDGQMGNEGFIACTGEHDQLLWAFFFEDTNPIKALSIKDKTLVAVNEHAELQIVINLEQLTEITMHYLND